MGYRPWACSALKFLNNIGQSPQQLFYYWRCFQREVFNFSAMGAEPQSVDLLTFICMSRLLFLSWTRREKQITQFATAKQRENVNETAFGSVNILQVLLYFWYCIALGSGSRVPFTSYECNIPSIFLGFYHTMFIRFCNFMSFAAWQRRCS